MRKILLFVFVFVNAIAHAQNYNNEWIDYTKTYYKFKVAGNGLHRIGQPVLQSAGIAATPAQHFQLWRNGVQVPLFTSVATGTLGAADYIEFWGEMNDGKMDNDMYNIAAHHINRKWNLINDTASYFLTIEPNAALNLRLSNTPNNVATNTLPVETNFMHKVGEYGKTIINPGFAAVVGENLHASAYDNGEGWTGGDIYPGNQHLTNFNNLYPDLSASTMPSYTIGSSGNALNPRSVQTKINSTQVIDQQMDYFTSGVYNVTFPLSLLASGNAALITINNSSNGNDRMVVAYQEITYPRLFNFGGASNFDFELAPSAVGNYLEITNFNTAATTPILYDVTNGKRYVAVVAGATLKFVLEPSATKRKLVLVNQSSSNYTSVTSLQSKAFTNFMAAANQWDYLILSSKFLHSNTSSSNVVEKYKAYRSSVLGGSFNVKIVDADDLYDQYSFGIDKHPIALRNYFRQARNVFSVTPKFILIIGRGTSYNESWAGWNQPYLDILNQIPTFGYPASDNLLTANPNTSIQTTPIGRLGAIYPSEVEVYLEKLKQYDQAQADMNFTIANKAWMLNGTFVAGSSEPFLQGLIDQYQTQYMNYWRDTSIGGEANLFTKTQAGGVVPLTNSFMEQLWNTGHSVVEYFGHSSATTLEFNLDDPNAYTNAGKYPLMVINGCNAGNYFVNNPFRITTNNNQTLSEKFVFAPNRGSIGFLASSHFGVVNYLHYYNTNFFKNASTTDYGKSIGEIMKTTTQGMFSLTGTTDFYSKMHAEQIMIQGDPAIKLNTSYPKPDYVIEEQTVKVNPSFISVAEPSFKVNVYYMNLGRAIVDSFNISVKRQYPSGIIETVYNRRVKAANYADTLSFNFDIQALRDKGPNKITICLDGDNEISEMSEINNCITKDVFIFEDEARPVHPYNYAIVNQLPVKLSASSADPLALNRTYLMELDTTELFNSPSKVTQSLVQNGGLLEFAPINNLINNTVYYWRVAPQTNTGTPNWNVSSFTYINGSSYGFNQGHVYQHHKSEYNKIKLDSATRRFNFDSVGVNISIRNGVWPTAAFEEGHATVSVNQDAYIRGICGPNHIVFNVFNPVTGQPWINNPLFTPGLYNSEAACFYGREYNFNYTINSPVTRKHAMDFIDAVPNGYYIVIRNTSLQPWWFGTAVDDYVSTWQADQSLYGAGNSLYHKLKNLGCTQIDSFTKLRSYIFVARKGMNSTYPTRQVMSEGEWDRISLATTIVIPDSVGYVTSPKFGPAKNWKEVHWRGNTIDAAPGDIAKLTLIGVRPTGVEDSLTTLDQTQLDFNIQNISAIQYPYLRLKMRNVDTSNGTPWQLNYWRLNYDPIPEGAVAPNITLQIKDSVDVGEPLQVKLAFKNISYAAFDSIKVKMIVLDRNSSPVTFVLPKQKPLAIGDVLTIDYTIPTVNFSGINSLYVDVNPDNDQPEQFHFNNFLFKNFFVRPDNYNPLLDVTFDGVHILNKDIVSSKPNIVIKLKDESKFLALDDPNGFTIQLRYPNAAQGVLKTFAWGTDTLKFIPANLSGGDNTATAQFNPTLLEDGDYELIVKGKDKTGNKSGDLEYKIIFKVINKPMISNMLNYPNPFTTSTAFVFTITGKEVPQNIKIEIMTITGKIVRQITKAELGTLRIGRNITEFKWDGTDQYGAKVANGVYLYRVVTNLNGKSLEKFKLGEDDKTDQYFNKGYGKMVLIR
jgi:hypothetical protein